MEDHSTAMGKRNGKVTEWSNGGNTKDEIKIRLSGFVDAPQRYTSKDHAGKYLYTSAIQFIMFKYIHMKLSDCARHIPKLMTFDIISNLTIFSSTCVHTARKSYCRTSDPFRQY